MARCTRSALLVAAVLLLPTIAGGQSFGGIAGLVQDTSGAVLPGVTVEASSPALIEKVRVVTTDGNGRYEIVSLRPGNYTVTFTLPGFSTVRREGITLAGEFTATVNVEMRLGAVEETITVSGETTLVDFTSVKRERVMTGQIIEALPTSRLHGTLAQLVPGIQAARQDVGGTQIISGLLSGHGTRGDDSRIMINGISQASTRNAGGGRTTPNVGAMEEVTINFTGADASAATGGIAVNLIPREGGNTLRSSSYAAYGIRRSQTNNLTSDLFARGLTRQNKIKDNWDINPSFGGPIMRDRLWFFFTSRNITANEYVGGMFVNKNAGNPSAWTYDPDFTRQAFARRNWKDNQVRLTWQMAERHKLGGGIEELRECECWNPTATTTPEAASGSHGGIPRGRRFHYSLDYSSPLSNRLLVEAAMYQRFDHWTQGNFDGTQAPFITPDKFQSADLSYLSKPPYINRVSIQSTGLNYRAQGTYNDSRHIAMFYRGSVSYVTGTHNLKVGFNNDPSWLTRGTNVRNPLFYRFNRPIEEGGVPNQLNLSAAPYYPKARILRSLGIYVQDKWTVNRLTLSLGLRYDNFVSGAGAVVIGPAPLVPNRNISLPEVETVNWKDVTPRSGLAYDLFGNGKTSVKVALSKFMLGQGLNRLPAAIEPFATLVNSTTRSWTDANGNFIPDCNILDPARQDNRSRGGDLCGPMANSAFGTTRVGTTVDPALAKGWGSREYNWEFSTGVQHELIQGLVVDVSYFRRWYGNHTVRFDQALSAKDFDEFSIIAPTNKPFAGTAPAGAQLPNGGGYVISGLYNLKPDKFGTPADNYITFAKNYGEQIERWNGVDVAVSARLPIGLQVQGGTSTGRQVAGDCDIRAKFPQIAPTDPWCHEDQGFLTTFTGYATYVVPKIDVLTSVTWQNRPSRANPIQANFRATNAFVRPFLGRDLSGGESNITVPLIEPWSILGDRFTQLDLRIGKVVRVARVRTTFNFDIFNALNSSAILAQNSSFDVWQRPQEILTGRFLKVGLQFDF